MARKQLWFGIPGARMQWVPAPSAGLSRTHLSYRDSFETITSKLALKKSNAYRARFEMEFPVQASAGLEGIDVFNKFASGFYGDGVTNGKIIFADPYSADNLFPPEWASPGLWARGWSRIADADPTMIVETSVNDYNLPPLTANYTVTDSVIPDKRCWIAVPPGYTLYWGMTGEPMITTRGLGARPIAADGSYGSITYQEGVAISDPDRMAAVGFDGDDDCVAVEFFLYGASTGTLQVNSMMARLFPTGGATELTGDHQHGLGHNPLEFVDDAIPQTYEYITGTLKGLSTALEETL